MSYKILTEASGSMTSGYIIKAIQAAGYSAVTSDVEIDIAAKYLSDDFIRMPYCNDPLLWEKTLALLKKHEVNIVIPSFDELLVEWSLRKEQFKEENIHVFVSDPAPLQICLDKWKTYQFFEEFNIPTPKTSIEQIYKLVKPRFGRGAKGVAIVTESIDMTGMISQQIVEGIEYTIDVLCTVESVPVYIVPRKRFGVKEGKSTAGIVVHHPVIEKWVGFICSKLRLMGPINMQCFETEDGTIQFIEINPRLAGGMALGFAATENWIPLMVQIFIRHQHPQPVEIQYGMKMMRYYDEVFVPSN